MVSKLRLFFVLIATALFVIACGETDDGGEDFTAPEQPQFVLIAEDETATGTQTNICWPEGFGNIRCDIGASPAQPDALRADGGDAITLSQTVGVPPAEIVVRVVDAEDSVVQETAFTADDVQQFQLEDLANGEYRIELDAFYNDLAQTDAVVNTVFALAIGPVAVAQEPTTTPAEAPLTEPTITPTDDTGPTATEMDTTPTTTPTDERDDSAATPTPTTGVTETVVPGPGATDTEAPPSPTSTLTAAATATDDTTPTVGPTSTAPSTATATTDDDDLSAPQATDDITEPTAAATVTATVTSTITVTATDTPTNTPTNTASPTPTNTATFTPSATATATATPSATLTPTATATPTRDPDLPTFTVTPFGAVATDTPTSTATATETATATASTTASPTTSPVPASVTPTDIPATSTATPTPVGTDAGTTDEDVVTLEDVGAPPIVLLVDGEEFTPLGGQFCTDATDEATCETFTTPPELAEEMELPEIALGTRVSVQVDFDERPLLLDVELRSRRGLETVFEETQANRRLIVFDVDVPGGSYILDVEVTWEDIRAIYIFELSVDE
jgi:hypothetical protein